jgi:transposase
MPAKYVRPYSKGQKNDFRDAEAIAEAVQRPTMKFVTAKTADQPSCAGAPGQPTHRHHQSNPRLLAGARHRSAAGATLLANRVATHSRHAARRALTSHGAPHRRSDWGLAPARSAHRELSSEIEDLANRDPACVRLMSVPGIGPIISGAMVAAIGTGDGFSKGRDFAAWLGLVPKQPNKRWRESCRIKARSWRKTSYQILMS